jgi:glycosyltransferase 2 family protein
VSKTVKTVLQYIFIFAITALLIWFSLRGLTVPDNEGQPSSKWDYLTNSWNNANKWWLIFMAVVILISHLIRAERWKMLMESTGYHTKLSDGFLSLMVGYLVNLVIPRGGEISRCYNLYKLNKTPVEISFGTVVVERIIDLICLVCLLVISFALESKKLLLFIDTLPIGEGESKAYLLIYAFIVLVVCVGIVYVIFRRNHKFRDFVLRTWTGFKGGLMSVFKVRQKGLFIFYSILIWVLYFAMSYMVIQAFQETKHLGLDAVLSLFAIGSIAMAAPLPGGTGSYHVLVPQGLVFLYGIKQADAVAFVFIFHGWQTALMILFGAIALVITSILVKKK